MGSIHISALGLSLSDNNIVSLIDSCYVPPLTR